LSAKRPAAKLFFTGPVKPVGQHKQHNNYPQNQQNMVGFHGSSPWVESQG
jgi:hypothetical protein